MGRLGRDDATISGKRGQFSDWNFQLGITGAQIIQIKCLRPVCHWNFIQGDGLNCLSHARVYCHKTHLVYGIYMKS